MANGTSNGRRCIRIIASKNDLDLANGIKRLLKKDEQQEIQCDLRFVNLDNPQDLKKLLYRKIVQL